MSQDLLEWIEKERKRRISLDFAMKQLLKERMNLEVDKLKKVSEMLREIENPSLEFLSSVIADTIKEIEQNFDHSLRSSCAQRELDVDGEYPRYFIKDNLNCIRVQVLEPFAAIDIDGHLHSGRNAKPDRVVQTLARVLCTKRKTKLKESDVQRFASVLESCYNSVVKLVQPSEGIVKIRDVVSLLRTVYDQQGIEIDPLILLSRVYDNRLLDLEFYSSRSSRDSVQIETREGSKSYTLMRIKNREEQA